MPLADLGGVRIHWEEIGAGPPIVLIQGLGYDHRPFQWLANLLAGQARVITFDNRGVGLSDKPPGPYSIETMAGDVAGLIEMLGLGRTTVFGVSLGGYVAQSLALSCPQLVAGLVLGCTYFTGKPERIRMPAETLRVLLEREGTPERIARRGLAIAFAHGFPGRRPDIFEQLVKWRVDDPIPAHGYRAQLDAGLAFDLGARVGRISAPTLVIHGSDDSVVPVERAPELGAAIPGSRVEILRGAGHLFFVEEASRTASMVLDFASEVAAGRTASGQSGAGRWIEGKARLVPSHAALIDGPTGDVTTYEEMISRSRRLAAYLHSRGTAKGDRVGVLAFNRPEQVETLVACATLGAVLVPLNYRLHTRELAGIIGDAQITVLIHDAAHAPVVEALGDALPAMEHRILLDGPADSPDPCVTWCRIMADTALPAAPSPELRDDDPWILCYTGGTTGRPKGAILTHGSVLWNAINTVSGWGLRGDDVTIVFSPMFHTGGLNVLLTPLMLAGGTSVIVPGFDPEASFDLIERYRPTWVFLVPAMFRMMTRSPRWDSARFESVRDFVTGGAPCPSHVHEALASKGKRFRVGYGLTEAGPNNFHIDPSDPAAREGSVGWPLPFVEARVVDPDGRACATDEVGDLELRGPHLFAGYRNRPEETAGAMRDGWLRTGDLARRDASGLHFIVGRRKEMFISGGENVYPAEVEQVLALHPAVDEAAVTGVPDERWGEVGLAAVVLRRGMQATELDLGSFCRERIAGYKVPRSFVFVPELPRTGAGKVDRPALRSMGRDS